MRVLVAVALLLEAGYLALNRLGDLQRFVVEYIAISLAMSVFYLFGCWWAEKKSGGSTAVVVLAGLGFRLTVAGLYPTLTEDSHRYRWEGKLQAAGGNPYATRPEDPRWAQLRDRTWEKVNRKDLPTAYGPLLEWCYRFTYRGAAAVTADEFTQVRLFKVPFLVFELATAALLARWRPQALVAYFWSPLVVVEFWGNGHTDSMLLFFLVAALWAASAGRWGLAYGALWGATLVKFWPALLFPLFWRHGGGRGPGVGGRGLGVGGEGPGARGQVLGAAGQGLGAGVVRAGVVVGWLPLVAWIVWPYWAGMGELQRMLAGFLGGWTNNASLFHLVYAAAGDFERAKPVVAALILAAVAAITWRRPPLVEGTLAIVLTLLLLGANCFPWYLTTLPALAPLPAALLLWTALAPLSYHVLIDYQALGVWRETPLYLWLEYLPVYGMLLAWLWRRKSRRGP